MEFKEVVKSRRSCRAFESDSVPQDQLAAIMEAGQWAPSPHERPALAIHHHHRSRG